jgi:hypothetical protein
VGLPNYVAQEPEGSSPHSQEPASDPYPEPGESIPRPPPPQPISLRSILTLSSHLCLGLSSGPFPLGFPTKTLYTFLPSPMRATCPTHLILLDFICLINLVWVWLKKLLQYKQNQLDHVRRVRMIRHLEANFCIPNSWKAKICMTITGASGQLQS